MQCCFKISAGLCHLGPNILQLSVLQPPQHIRGGVPSDAKVERMERREILPPYLWTGKAKEFHLFFILTAINCLPMWTKVSLLSLKHL